MKKLLIAILAFVLIISLHNCKKDEPKNPCDEFKEAKANFQILGGVNNNWPIVSADSTYVEFDTAYLNGVSVTFNVVDRDIDSCWWNIGTDPRVFRDKSFFLDFIDEGQYRVQLVIKAKKIEGCNKSGGYDTSVKYFVIKPQNENPIYGSYTGAIDDAPDKIFTIDLKNFNSQGGIAIYNFPPNCDTTNSIQYIDAFRISELSGQFYFQGNTKKGTFECDVMRSLEKQRQGQLQPSYTPHGYFSKITGDITLVWWQRTKIQNGQAIQRRRVFYGKKL